MTRLLYGEALETVIENTEIGYSLRSLDRLWTVFCFDEDGERLYFTDEPRMLSYDHMDNVLVWTRRAEAEAFAEEMRDALIGDGRPEHSVHVINEGDDHRSEVAWIYERRYLVNGKFRGSDEAIQALNNVRRLRGKKP